VSCQRESRSFRPETPSTEAVRFTRLTDFVAGGLVETNEPENNPTEGSLHNGYEDSAYAISEGKTLYSAFNCNGCHARGGGGMGVPLMDNDWIYGHRPEQIFSTIVEGRPNGMPSFGGKIPAYQVWQLVAYVRSLSGLTSSDAAPNREDHLYTGPPETSAPSPHPSQSGPSPATEKPE